MSIQAARRQAGQLLARLGIVTIPVDVESVAKSLSLKVKLDDLGPEISGLLVTPPSGKSQIYVNRADHLHRRRFTIAHEIGHSFLQHQFEEGDHVHVDRGNYISQRGPRASAGIDPKEVEANQFAACLLMPEHQLRAAASRLTEGPLHDQHVSKLADQFEVSEQAMAIRLAAIDLL